MREIARAAKVSISAVCLALQNSPKISATRKSQILTLAQRMGYRPDPRISELMSHLRTTRANRPSSQVALLIPELSREQLSHYPPIIGMVEGAKEVADSAGFKVEAIHLADRGMSPKRARSILVARGIKGVLVAPFASGVAKLDFNFDGFCAATAGYSIVEPRLHRACPNYLQMMEEMLATCVARGYERLGLAMTYNEGGIGHKLFSSAFLYYQSKIPRAQRIPVLPKPEINADNLRAWIDRYEPEVVIGAGPVFTLLQQIGLQVPRDLAFLSIDVSEPPDGVAGADHRYRLVGREAFQLVLSQMSLNLTNVPADPKVVLVDSHQRPGFSLPTLRTTRTGRPVHGTRDHTPAVKSFRGFLD